MFRGNSPKTSWQRVFGGQVIGQAMVAACRTVEGRLPHSLHCYFILPAIRRFRSSTRSSGCATAELLDPPASPRSSTAMRSSRSWCRSTPRSRRVRSPGQDAGRSAAGKTHRRGSGRAADVSRDAGLHPPLLRVRPPDRTSPGRTRPLFRPEDRGRPHPCLDSHRGQTARRSGAALCALAYALDFSLLDAVMARYGRTPVRQAHDAGEPRPAMWFHRPFRADEWLLYAQDSPERAGR